MNSKQTELLKNFGTAEIQYMKEIPILFSTSMVQAILEGRKTMTRRTKGLDVINEKPDAWVFQEVFTHVGKYEREKHIFRFVDGKGGFVDIPCPYGKPGDVLWARESFSEPVLYDGAEPDYLYKTDGDIQRWGGKPWKPSIHMPKAAARIWLQVTDIRVERLQDITEEDAIAEGILHDEIGFKDYDKERAKGYGHPDYDYPHVQDARLSFLSLWESINGFESRNANPWVWVVSFKVLSITGRPETLNKLINQ